jgi:hypothetical protein
MSRTRLHSLGVFCLVLALGGRPGGAQDLDGAAETLDLRKIFHIAGLPEVKRNGRVNLRLSSRNLIIDKGDREILNVPFRRISSVTVGPAERVYGKTTYAAVLAAGAPGALLLLKKRKVDAVSIDFENDQGGQMTVLVQVSKGDGARCSQWLRRHGVKIEAPPTSIWLQEPKSSETKTEGENSNEP